MKRLLQLLVLNAIFFNYLTYAQVPTDSLVAYYPFNGNANDESGNGWNATENIATLTSDRFGNNNSAYIFDGDSNKITIGDLHPNINQFSISLWLKTADINADDYNNRTLISDAGYYQGFRIFQVSNSIYFEIQNNITSGAYEITCTLTKSDSSKWIHIVGESNEGFLNIYKNGIFVADNYVPLGSMGKVTLGIGYDSNINSFFWNGALDDIRIYNRVLSEEEITNLYNEKITGLNNIEDMNLSFQLYQNFPNPFNPVTTIKYSIPQTQKVTIKIFDIPGNEIKTLVNEEKPSGNYEVKFDGNNLASGIYYYRLQSGSYVQTKKMILLK